MQNDDIRLEDLLTHPEFRKWVLHQDPMAAAFWTSWMKAHPEQRDKVLQARSILLKMQFSYEEPEEGVQEALLTNILHHDQPRLYRAASSGKWIGIVIRVAAILLFFFSVWGVHQLSQPDSKEAGLVTRVNPPGQRAQFLLPDGSKVWLSVASQLTFPEEFTNGQRRVQLEGEAFFEVVENPAQPFIVSAQGVDTRALGTSFNIKAFRDDALVQVVLASGKVKVSHQEGASENAVLLSPGEEVWFEKNTNTLLKQPADLKQALAWKQNTLVFEKASAEEVFTTLERWYGVEITSEGLSDNTWRFTGQFQDENLENILLSIGYVKGFSYQLDHQSVVITPLPKTDTP